MPVSSYVLRCRPEDQPRVIDQLRALPGVLIGEATDQGIPVATESRTTREASTLGDRLGELQGVRSAVLVYHNFEDLEDEPDAEKAAVRRSRSKP